VPSTGAEDLAEQQYVTVILRLVLGDRGGLLRGELADAAGERLSRFRGWEGLAEAIRSYLARRSEDRGPQRPRP
jgi:hypothetical protein